MIEHFMLNIYFIFKLFFYLLNYNELKDIPLVSNPIKEIINRYFITLNNIMHF